MRRRIFRRRGPTGFGRFRSKRGLRPSRNLRLCSRTCCCATCGICGCGWWNRGSMRALSVLGFLLLGGSIWAQQYVISTIAGGAPPATPSLAPTASIGDPTRLATDAAGNVYFGSLHSLFKVDAGGTLTRVAGNARPGNSGDGGPAATAQLNFPMGIAVDAAGNGSGNGTKGGENSVQVSSLVDRINRLEETLRTVRLENERLKGA